MSLLAVGNNLGWGIWSQGRHGVGVGGWRRVEQWRVGGDCCNLAYMVAVVALG